jgi:antitoxin component YwqK of YwqJK toxin-antitoxin module
MPSYLLQGYIMKHTSLFFSSLLIFFFLGCSQSQPTPEGEEVLDVKKEFFTGGKVSSEFLMIDKTGQNGTLKKYGYNGKVTSISRVRNGVKDGIETWYDGKGRPIRRMPYINGRVHGTYTELYANGDKMVEIQIINGVKEGEAYSYNVDGSIARTVIYSQGKIIN